MFKVNFGESLGAFGVPNEIVDQHLKLAGALSIKVLLILLRTARPMELSEISKLLNQSDGNIKDAINYWVQLNFITEEGSPTQSATKTESTFVAPAAKVTAPEPAKKVVAKERFYRMNRHDVNEVSQGDNNVGILIDESQNILVRPLSSGEGETIVSFYHHYGMKIDIILMMLHYCKSISKDNPAYYEKMALDWINREIDTHEKAEQELLRLTQADSMEKELRKTFGIYNRKISKKEMEFYNSWKNDYNMDNKMISLAYERTINANGKMSFHYINAILKAWFEKNITTPLEAETESNNTKPRQNNQPANSNASYSLDELDKIITKGNVWD